MLLWKKISVLQLPEHLYILYTCKIWNISLNWKWLNTNRYANKNVSLQWMKGMNQLHWFAYPLYQVEVGFLYSTFLSRGHSVWNIDFFDEHFWQICEPHQNTIKNFLSLLFENVPG
jgi:hypothetical protein